MSKLLHLVRQWLRVPSLEERATAAGAGDRSEPDPEGAERRLQYLGVLNRAWFTFGAIALITMPLYRYWQVSITIALGCGLTYVIVQSLLHTQSLRAACITFCLCTDTLFFVTFLVLAVLVGPVEAFRTEAPVLMLMGITALFAGALIGPRTAWAVAAINTVVIIGTRLWLAPEADPRPSTIVFGWLLAGVAFLYEHSLRQVFAQLRNVRIGLEATILDRTKELRTSIQSLEKLATQLTAANRDLELFSSSVAHDLRGPLRVIEGYSRLLQQDFAANNPEAAQALQRMMQVESRMSRLIEGLLSFARLGNHALNKRAVDMTALARRTADELREQESARILQIDIDELPTCCADALLIEQVLVNLLANASKFTRPRTVAQIAIRGRQQNGEVIFSVKDNGVGFPMDQVDRLFNTLQRLHAYEDFEGTGIGLATVQRIVQRHGGRVWAQGEPNVGAEFFFALPVQTQPA
jgi:signal transduction histidine kinase